MSVKDTARRLDEELKAAGLPIVGVSIGADDDRTTWTVQFDARVTPIQRLEAEAIVAAYQEPDETTTKEEAVDRELQAPVLSAAIQALYEAIPDPKLSLDAVAARARELATKDPIEVG